MFTCRTPSFYLSSLSPIHHHSLHWTINFFLTPIPPPRLLLPPAVKYIQPPAVGSNTTCLFPTSYFKGHRQKKPKPSAVFLKVPVADASAACGGFNCESLFCLQTTDGLTAPTSEQNHRAGCEFKQLMHHQTSHTLPYPTVHYLHPKLR